MNFPIRFALVLTLGAAGLGLWAAEQEGPMSPEVAAGTFETFADLEVEQVLAEPEVRQPVFMAFDERGRLWVMQYLQYPAPAGLTLMSKDQFWRAVYDKVPPPPPKHIRGEDKITIHEDTDGDGWYDKQTTFVDGLNIATAFAFGRGGVWVLNPPYLLFYPDRNRDDQPDGPPEVHLAGFGLEDTHSVVNSLRWGPDGWLYAAQGSTVSGEVVRPGIDKEPMRTMGQLIWRYHPEKRVYEIFAEGGGNAFGVEIDDKGRIFSGHNGGDTRGFHYVQGAYLQKGFEKHGPLSNPYAFGYFRQMPHDRVERFTHNFVIYGGGSLPEGYTGKLFGVEPLQGRVVLSEISHLGSSFRTEDIGYAMRTTDRYFKPVDIKVGPDGAIYVADWYDRQVAHTRNYEGLIDKTNGRIYRLKKKGAAPLPRFDLGQLPTAELLGYLNHSNRWFRQTALQLIGDRKDQTAVEPLLQMIRRNVGQVALEALWGLHLSGGLTEALGEELLRHRDPHVRLWTVRLFGDEKHLTQDLSEKLAGVAATEPHLEVRSQLASTCKRLPAAQALPILTELFKRDEDTTDIYIPLLLWWALESKIERESGAVLQLFREKSLWEFPLVQQHIAGRLMRRYAMVGTREALLNCARLLEWAPNKSMKKLLLEELEQGTKGRSVAQWPDELQLAISKAGGDTLPISVRKGEKEAVERVITLLKSEATPVETKVQYTQILGEREHPEALGTLLEMGQSKSSALQRAALHGLQVYRSGEVGTKILQDFSRISPENRIVAFNLLASRPSWAAELIRKVKEGDLKASEVPPEIVLKLSRLKIPEISKGVGELWPASESSAATLRGRIEAVRKVVQSGSGDPFPGQKHYEMACSSCHKLFGQGGEIGPDLTSFRREDLDTMLEHIINPNAEIREGYENIVIETKDGRTISGFLADQDDRVYVVRGMDNENTVVRRSEVEEFRAAGGSLMPEGLLDSFDEQALRDLFAYLRSSQPLVRQR